MALFVTAEFQDTDVSLAGRFLVVRTTIRNRSNAPWRAGEGWNTGYHLFDNPTGTLVIDGERAPLDLPPGGEKQIETRIPLPQEPGDYSVYVSPMQEHVAWLYEKGSPFILIDVAVDDSSAPALRRWQLADQGALARRRFLRGFGSAFALPLRQPWRNRSLIGTLVRRDIMSRYAGSLAGALWTILNPLLLMLTYFFVFGIVLQARADNDPTVTGFAFYFLTGMMPWLAFSDAVARAPGILVEHRNFIRKLVFPVEILPVNLVATGLVTEFFGIVVLVVALLIGKGHVPLTALYLPVVIVPQVLLTAGFCWFLAALGVFVRDLSQINGYLLTIWFFVTPICYSESQQEHVLSPQMLRLSHLNPVYVLVRNYRRILLEAAAPDWTPLLLTTAVSVVIFLAGHAWFHKLRRSFADLI
ncbi:MAG TPA: ABC transporter permease [Bryobacteraceae bacterium]|nr:ABC transporter permease [Bryobacteraceae bacterium]